MNSYTKQTTMVTRENATRNWVLVEVENQVVGRAASKIAQILRGKHRPEYVPHLDNGDFVVVINAAKVKFTGKKLEKKKYYHHTGFPGGIKEITAEKQLEKHPERVLEQAIWGMLPKSALSKNMMKKLKIYAGTEHPHAAQNPVAINL